MTQSLHLLVTHLSTEWEELLLQSGLSFSELPRDTVLSQGDASVLLVTSALQHELMEQVLEWVREGGAVLDVGNHLGTQKATSCYLRYLKAGDYEQKYFPTVWNLELYSHVLCFEQAEGSFLWNNSVVLNSMDNGAIAVLGFDPSRLCFDTRRARKRFYREGGLAANETVSLVSKHEVTRVLHDGLLWLHAQRGLPMVRLVDFPRGEESVFTMRMDSDYGTLESIQKASEMAGEYGLRLSWFLHLEPMRERLEELWEIEEQGWSLHGVKHETYTEYDRNYQHILEGLVLLREAGKEVRGISAPFGIWNENWQRAVEDAGLEYASEFGFAYDGFPFRPVLNGRRSATWQIPVHPICPGNFFRIMLPPEDIAEYYTETLERKIAFRDPIFFYHHPLHEIPEAEEELYEAVQESGLACLTYDEWMEWWLQRVQQPFRATLENGVLRLEGATKSIPLLVELPGKLATVREDVEVGTESLPWEDWKPQEEYPVPDDWEDCRALKIELVEHCLQDVFNLARQDCDTEGHSQLITEIGEWNFQFTPNKENT